MEQDISSIEKRFAYGFLQKLLKWMDIAQEFIAHLGTVVWNVEGYCRPTVQPPQRRSAVCFSLYVSPHRGCSQQWSSGEVAT